MKRDAYFTAVMNYLQALEQYDADKRRQLIHEVNDMLNRVGEIIPQDVKDLIVNVASYKFETDLPNEEIANILGISPEEVQSIAKFIEEFIADVFIAVLMDSQDFLDQVQYTIFESFEQLHEDYVTFESSPPDRIEKEIDEAVMVRVLATLQSLDRYRTRYTIGPVVKNKRYKIEEKQYTLFDVIPPN